MCRVPVPVLCAHSLKRKKVKKDNTHPARVKFGSPFLLPSRKMEGVGGGGSEQYPSFTAATGFVCLLCALVLERTRMHAMSLSL